MKAPQFGAAVVLESFGWQGIGTGRPHDFRPTLSEGSLSRLWQVGGNLSVK
ncbi:MAG: hypothetical protein ABI939_05290 [Anaerolineaceae bacterium]